MGEGAGAAEDAGGGAEEVGRHMEWGGLSVTPAAGLLDGAREDRRRLWREGLLHRCRQYLRPHR